MRLIPTVMALALSAIAANAARQPFERYQSIVDRQMFGTPPPGFDPLKMPSAASRSEAVQLTKEQEKLQSSIHFSVINVTPDGAVAVGFTDNSDSKAPVHYYLKVGERRNGWEVKEADPAKATMTIAKGDIEVSLSLGGNSAKDASATAKAGAGVPATPENKGIALLNSMPAMRGGSLLSRRRLREDALRKSEAAAAALEAERKAQAEAEKEQREADRAEYRQSLEALRDELKRVREEKAAAAQAPAAQPATEEQQ